MPSKEEEGHIGKAPAEGEGLPAYSADEAGPSTATRTAEGPTTESPFNFPSAAPPAYSAAASSSGSKKPVAIPQQDPDPASPFVSAYAPVLLTYGIPPETWRSFLDTLSAFLTAKVSERAISHAGDVAKQVGQRPKNFVKGVVSHAKEVGKGISNNAKRGNILGAAMGVVGGAISIPISAAMGTVGTVLSLPGSAVAAAARKPQTPRERAAAYVAVANRDWLQSRGLFAAILDTKELSQALGASAAKLLESSQAPKESKDGGAGGQLLGLQQHIEVLEIDGAAKLSLGEQSLWVVVTQLISSEA